MIFIKSCHNKWRSKRPRSSGNTLSARSAATSVGAQIRKSAHVRRDSLVAARFSKLLPARVVLHQIAAVFDRHVM